MILRCDQARISLERQQKNFDLCAALNHEKLRVIIKYPQTISSKFRDKALRLVEEEK